jgi:hypothetical protein
LGEQQVTKKSHVKQVITNLVTHQKNCHWSAQVLSALSELQSHEPAEGGTYYTFNDEDEAKLILREFLKTLGIGRAHDTIMRARAWVKDAASPANKRTFQGFANVYSQEEVQALMQSSL